MSLWALDWRSLLTKKDLKTVEETWSDYAQSETGMCCAEPLLLQLGIYIMAFQANL